jgi:hypothetical protein
MTVQELYKGTLAFIRQDETANFDNDKFNECMKQAEAALFSHYERLIGQIKQPQQALLPFIKTIWRPFTGSQPHHPDAGIPFPDTEVIKRDLGVTVIVEGVYHAARRLTPHIKQRILGSSIRRPDAEASRYAYEWVKNATGSKICIYPVGSQGTAVIEYLTYPNHSYRGANIVSGSNFEPIEEYDPLTSVQPLWADTEYDNLVALICHFSTIATRDPSLAMSLLNRNVDNQASI